MQLWFYPYLIQSRLSGVALNKEAIGNIPHATGENFWSNLETQLDRLRAELPARSIGLLQPGAIFAKFWQEVGIVRERFDEQLHPDFRAAIRIEINRTMIPHFNLVRMSNNIAANGVSNDSVPGFAEMVEQILLPTQYYRLFWYYFAKRYIKDDFYQGLPFDAIESLARIAELAQSYLLYQHVCFICAKPTVISVDEGSRAHKISGPAPSIRAQGRRS